MTQIARFMVSTWGPPGADMTQVGSMSAHEPAIRSNLRMDWLWSSCCSRSLYTIIFLLLFLTQADAGLESFVYGRHCQPFSQDYIGTFYCEQLGIHELFKCTFCIIAEQVTGLAAQKTSKALVISLLLAQINHNLNLDLLWYKQPLA